MTRRGRGTVWPATPIEALRTRPWRMSSDTTKLAVLLATAKQMPCAPMMTAVLMPITWPEDATSGPPELPGLRAASVWITSSISRPDFARRLRPSAETTPAVTVDSKPSGLPMAMAIWPRFSSLESPRAAKGSQSPLARSKARSVSGSSPITRASMGRPSDPVSLASRAPCITWLLVSSNPSGEMMTPDPIPAPRPDTCGSTRTTAGPMRSTTAVTARE